TREALPLTPADAASGPHSFVDATVTVVVDVVTDLDRPGMYVWIVVVAVSRLGGVARGGNTTEEGLTYLTGVVAVAVPVRPEFHEDGVLVDESITVVVTSIALFTRARVHLGAVIITVPRDGTIAGRYR